jgi:hypothetical protein
MRFRRQLEPWKPNGSDAYGVRLPDVRIVESAYRSRVAIRFDRVQKIMSVEWK